MSVVYFLLLLSALVVVHEFGHFVAAKLLDFKVLRFSVGFGRALLRVNGKETVYQIGIVPLGGYVRILGEDDSEPVPDRDAVRSFGAKPVWQRLIVVFAGPAANFLFPILIYFVLFAGHTTLPAAAVGDVIAGGPADRAGIEPGDRILSVDGESIRYWEQLEATVDGRAGQEVELRIARGERELAKYMVPLERIVRTRDGRSSRRGWIGVSQAPFRPQVGVIDSTSPAARAGLRTGDLIVSVDGKNIDNWTTLRRTLDGDARRRTVAFLRGEIVPGVPSLRLLEPNIVDLVPETRIDDRGHRTVVNGLSPVEMFVAHIEPDSPAAKSTLQPGDLLTTIDGRPVAHWMLLDQALQSEPDRTWTLGWLRGMRDGSARAMTGELRQVWVTVADEFGNEGEQLLFGASNDFDRGVGRQIRIDGRFSYAIGKSIERTGDTIVEMTGGFWSIVRGETPHEAVGGPLMMFRVASVSGSKGFDAFLLMLALISVNLGLINLLPVPMLDGGNLVIFAIEAVRREPLTAIQRRRVMTVGIAFVIGIMTLALRNDVVRYFF